MTTDNCVGYREIEAMLEPLIQGQNRIEDKVDSLIEHKDTVVGKLNDHEVRIALVESRRVNWPLLAAILAALLAWILPHLKWS